MKTWDHGAHFAKSHDASKHLLWLAGNLGFALSFDLRLHSMASYGRGARVGRGRGVGVDRGVSVAVAVGVTVAVAVAVAVGVAVTVAVAVAVGLGGGAVGVAVGVGVGVGVGTPNCTQYLPPVLMASLSSPNPPQTIISLPLQIAVCKVRASVALVVLVAIQLSVSGLYVPPVFTAKNPGSA